MKKLALVTIVFSFLMFGFTQAQTVAVNTTKSENGKSAACQKSCNKQCTGMQNGKCDPAKCQTTCNKKCDGSACQQKEKCCAKQDKGCCKNGQQSTENKNPGSCCKSKTNETPPSQK